MTTTSFIQRILPSRRRSARRRKALATGTSAAVDTLECRRLLVAPQMIENVQASQYGPPEMGITWDADPDAAQYEVRVMGTPIEFSETAFVTGTEYVVTFTEQRHFANSYDIAVRGIDSTGLVGPWSDTINYIFESLPADPMPPSWPQFALDQIGQYKQNATWIWSGNTPEYDVWISQEGVVGPVRRETVTLSQYEMGTSFDPGIYKIWVRGRDTTRVVDYESGWVGPITSALGGQQPEVTGPTTAATARPTITWDIGVPGIDYQLWVNKVGGRSKVILESGLDTNSFMATADMEDGIYQAWVRQMPAQSQPLPWSSAFRFAVGSSFGIPAIPVLSATGSNFNIDLTWATVDGASRYEVWFADARVGRVDSLSPTDLTETEYSTGTLTPRANGSIYRAWIRAVSAQDIASGWSDVVTFFLAPDGSVQVS